MDARLEVGNGIVVLFELVSDLVDTGFGAGLILIAARSAGYADRSNNLVADLDR